VRGTFQETVPVPRKTAENTVKHNDDGVGSAVTNQRDGGESSMVVTTLEYSTWNVTDLYAHTGSTMWAIINKTDTVGHVRK